MLSTILETMASRIWSTWDVNRTVSWLYPEGKFSLINFDLSDELFWSQNEPHEKNRKKLKYFSSPLHPISLQTRQDKQYPQPFPSTTECRYIWTTIKTFFLLQKSNRLSTKQDNCSSQKSLVFKKKNGGGGERKGNSKKSTKQKHKCHSVISNPKTGAARSVCARVWRHSAQSWEEETLWLVPSLAVLWVEGRWNVRPPVGLEEGAGGSRSGVQVGLPGGTGGGRSTAGSLLWLRRDPGTIADVATAGLSAKSSAGTAHTGKASPHYGHACVSQGGSAG